jgi:hypothetical protein
VVSLPGRFGREAYQQIATFGTKVNAGDSAIISTGLLNVLVARAARRTYLVAGLVQPALLQRVASDLVVR